jgi:hypothetical protein
MNYTQNWETVPVGEPGQDGADEAIAYRAPSELRARQQERNMSGHEGEGLMTYRDREPTQPGVTSESDDQNRSSSTPTTSPESSRSSRRGPPPPPPPGGSGGGGSGDRGRRGGSPGSSDRSPSESPTMMRDEDLFFSLPRTGRPPSRPRTVNPGTSGPVQSALGWGLPAEGESTRRDSFRRTSITPEEQEWLDATDKLSVHDNPYTSLPPPVNTAAAAGYASSSSATKVDSPVRSKGKGRYVPDERDDKVWESTEDEGAAQPEGENKGIIGGLLSSIGLAGLWGGGPGTKDDVA